jgi:lysylphosphatidylglycerol synthetase-like protein (DUF2156 family)
MVPEGEGAAGRVGGQVGPQPGRLGGAVDRAAVAVQRDQVPGAEPEGVLYRFNKKFAPAWQPRYLAVDATEDLPTVALACLRAEGLLTPASWRWR